MCEVRPATLFCGPPRRVTLTQLDELRAADAAAAAPAVPVPPAPAALLALPCSAPATPEGPCPVCPRLDAEFEPYRQAAFYKRMHQKAKEREHLLQKENQQLQARILYLEGQLYGTKTESAKARDSLASGSAPAAGISPDAPPPRPRGQQRGQPGPKRRDYSHLPAEPEHYDLQDADKQCPCCGLPYAPFPETEGSTILEIDVRAHRRVIHRKRYKPSCACPDNPGIITAPGPARLIPKSIFGVSVWTKVLLDKYLFYRPTYRLLQDLATHRLGLSQGSLTDGLKRLTPLFEPIYQKLVEHSQQQKLWHGDETRWLVFVTCEGKVGYRWYLWVFHAKEVVVFVLAMGRSHDVPEAHFGPVKQSGILVVDRYVAYQAVDKVKSGLIVLAFCWAHQRRDFLDLARSWPQLEAWALGWLARIRELYRRNDERVAVLDDPQAFAPADQQVRAQVAAMQEQAQAELAEAQVHPAQQRVLESMGNHWTGLTVFVEHPEVPMDNNTAERAVRGPVVGRKNYYGSGSLWSGQLAAMLFSLFQTLALWNINPRVWLTEYLQACAEAGGQAPKDVGPFLPWEMPEQKRQEWSLAAEKARDDSS